MRKALVGLVVTLLATSSFVTAEAQTDAAQKAPVVWDLTELYPTDSVWDAESKAVAAALPGLVAYKGTLGKDPASLAKALRAVSDLQRRLARLETYASLKRDEDTRVAANQERLQRLQLLATDFGRATAFINPEIVSIGQTKIDQFIAADPDLKVFAFGLHDILRKAPHTLGEEGEGVLAGSTTATAAPQTIYTLLANSDLPWPTVALSDGRQVRIDSQGYTGTRDLPNRDDRKKVFEAFFGKWTEYKSSIGASLDGNVEGTIFNAKARHYPTALSYAIAEHNIPDQVYRTLVDEANKGLPTLHRYFALRKKMLGLPDLRYYDMYVPLVKSDRKYTVDEAEAMTLTAVAPLGQDYVDMLKAGFAKSWMHALPQPGKKSGAYMNPSAYDVHPYVLANFTGNYDSVTTIAHEWGHAMHSVLANKAQPFETADYPIFLAEIASTNNEMLLQDNLIANAKTKEDKLFFLNQAIETIRTTFFRQTMFAEFELKAHEAAEKGEALSGDSLTKIYLDLLKRYHGDAQGTVKIDDLYGVEWAYIPHFYTDFYVYQYATCLSAAAYFSHGIEGGDTKQRDTYLNVLKSGGSDYPYDILKKAGLDMASPAPYQAIVARMNMLLDQMEKLTNG
ncbi:MAG: oligoendopeptidase family protein [Rhodospirillales bacterium]|nr:oligoendopeptidase family protein [Rhodospirillales bacterium]